MSAPAPVRVHEQADEAGSPQPQRLLLPGEMERMQAIQASSKFLLPAGTSWVEADVLGVAEEVNRRWPNLRIASCSCGQCERKGHYPHMVLEHCRDGVTRPVFGVRHLNRSVVDRLKAIHDSANPQARHQELKDRFRKEAAQQRRDEQTEMLEVVEAALRSPKVDWKGPKGMRTDPHAKAVR